jgi:hypothetical protein
MGIEPFGLGQCDDGWSLAAQPAEGIPDDTGALDEIVDSEGRTVASRTAGREDVTRAREIVAHRLGGVVTQEDGAGVPDGGRDPLRTLSGDLDGLGSAAIAWAPPTRKTRVIPESAQAESTASVTPFGGTTAMISCTPATRAGTAFMMTDEGYEAFPPGTYSPTRSSAVTFMPTTLPSGSAR